MIRMGDTSAASARRFQRLRDGHPPDSPRPSNRESAAVLDEIILRHVGHFARSGRLILADVRDDYGSVDERRFWNRLANLRKRGLIERTADGFRRSK